MFLVNNFKKLVIIWVFLFFISIIAIGGLYFKNRSFIIDIQKESYYKILKSNANVISKNLDLVKDIILSGKIKDIILIDNKTLMKMVLLPEMQKYFEKLNHNIESIVVYYDDRVLVKFGKYIKFRDDGYFVEDNRLYFSKVYLLTPLIAFQFIVDVTPILKEEFGNFIVSTTSISALDIELKLGDNVFVGIERDNSLEKFDLFYFKIALILLGFFSIGGILLWIVYKYFRSIYLDKDTLTSLFTLKNCRARSKYFQDYILLLIDVDDFSKINRDYGNSIGDKVLKEISKIIKLSLRKDDLVCRIKGKDRFVVLMPFSPLKPAIRSANKIRVRVEDYFINKDLKVSVSIGVSRFVGDFKESFLVAKRNLKNAKAKGKNRVEY